MADFAITICPGSKGNAQGTRQAIDTEDPVASLVRLLDASPRSREAWWSHHQWAKDYRLLPGWEGAVGVVADIDYISGTGDHSVPSPEDAARFHAAAPSLPGTHWHPTPRGTRLVALFAAPCSDPDLWHRAAAGFGAQVNEWLRLNRLDCDRAAHLPGYELDEVVLFDRARFLYGPHALVSGIQRNAEIIVLRAEPIDPQELAALAPPEEKPAAAKPPPIIRSERAHARFEDAATSYNAAHARDWGRPGLGQCPACGHKGCFGRAKDSETRWSCFSTNHVDGCGTRGESATTGDALDIDAFLAGVSPVEHLRAMGYLSATPSWEEPPPPTDDDAPPELQRGRASHLSLVPPDPSAGPPPKPSIRITTDEEQVNDQAIVALSRDDRVYQRGRALVQVLRGITASSALSRSADALTISDIALARLRELLANAAEYEQLIPVRASKQATGTDGPPAAAKTLFVSKRVHPPDWMVRAVAARGRWDGIRPLTGVTEWPVLRADGTILADPGYDARTGLYYEPAGGIVPIPQDPTPEEVADALALLREAVCDFPLAGGLEGSSFSAWLAALLTPLARYAFDGPAPLFLAEANVRGSGKTMLWTLIGNILAGRDMSSMPYSEDDDEMGKKITACARSGDPIIFLDNIADRFGGGRLDQALTSTSWRDRILGQSQNTPELPLIACWYATGNNLQLVGDIERRLCVCRIESTRENPEERPDGDFKHPDLLLWARQERRRLLSAALLLLRAYAAAGQPRGTWHLWGSYPGWSRLVKACLEWLGLLEPPTPRASGSTSPDLEELTILIDAFAYVDPQGEGLAPGDLLRLVRGEVEAANREDREPAPAIGALVDYYADSMPSPRKLAAKLARHRNRVVTGRCLSVAFVRRNAQHWVVRTEAQVTN